MEYFNPKQRWGEFTMIPDTIMRVPAMKLSFGAKCLYARLGRYYDEKRAHAYPSYETLGVELGTSDRQIGIYIKELITVGLIHQVKRGQGHTAVYKFPLHPWVDDREPPDQKETSGQDQNHPDPISTSGLNRKSISGLKGQSTSGPSLKKQDEERRVKREEAPAPVPILTAFTGQNRADLRQEKNLSLLWRDKTGQKPNPTQANEFSRLADIYTEQGRYDAFLEIFNEGARKGWKTGTILEVFDERLTGKSVPRGPAALKPVRLSDEEQRARYLEAARKGGYKVV